MRSIASKAVAVALFSALVSCVVNEPRGEVILDRYMTVESKEPVTILSYDLSVPSLFNVTITNFGRPKDLEKPVADTSIPTPADPKAVLKIWKGDELWTEIAGQGAQGVYEIHANKLVLKVATSGALLNCHIVVRRKMPGEPSAPPPPNPK